MKVKNNFIVQIKRFKCYKKREKEKVACNKKCKGIKGGDRTTAYLNKYCLDCKYWSN